MNKVFSRRNILFGFLLVAFIIVFEVAMLLLDLPAWPAFLVMIQFFVVHEDATKAPQIVIGGLFGIVCAILMGPFAHVVSPYTGMDAARLTFIGLFVYAIVLFKDALPEVFNSHAFLFFLVSSIAMKAHAPRPYVWMAVELVLGVVFVAGVLAIGRIVTAVLGGEPGARGSAEGMP